MKKLPVLMAIILAAVSFSVNAQQPAGGMQQMQQAFRQRMIDSLKFTPAQADSVLAVQQQFMPQIRLIRMNDSLSMSDKMQQFNAIHDQEQTRFSKFLSDDQIQKLQTLQQSMHPQMRTMRQTNINSSPGGGN